MKIKTLLLTALLSTTTLFGVEQFSDDFCDKPTLTISANECHDLENLWNSTNGTSWTNDNNWGINPDVSTWYGITMTDTNNSIEKLKLESNNLSGTLPNTLDNLQNITVLYLEKNNIEGNITQTFENFSTLILFSIEENNFHGSLPRLKKSNSLFWLTCYENNFTGPIPEEWGQFSELEYLQVQRNHLFGHIPDLSQTSLVSFRIFLNDFTFLDIEPQTSWIKSIDEAGNVAHYSGMHNIDEKGRIVYFDKTLRIEPRLEENPTGNDNYKWIKDQTTSNILSHNRIYIKEDANLSDEGYYNYEVNNTIVTEPNSRSNFLELYLYSTGHPNARHETFRNDALRAIHDNTPTIINQTPPKQISQGENYSYTSTVSDLDTNDNNDLNMSIGDLPDGLTFTFIQDENTFTLSGTVDTYGDYDINITVTDGKIPFHFNYVLRVNPSGDSLPLGFTFDEITDTYTHTDKGTSITGITVPTFPNGGIEFCEVNNGAFIAIDDDGLLTTGYKDCNTTELTETFTDPLPNNTKASIVTNNNEKMILIDLPLGDDMTLGGN